MEKFATFWFDVCPSVVQAYYIRKIGRKGDFKDVSKEARRRVRDGDKKCAKAYFFTDSVFVKHNKPNLKPRHSLVFVPNQIKCLL